MKSVDIEATPQGWREVTLENLFAENFCTIKNSLREPLSSKNRKQMQGGYPYYGAAKKIDSINRYKITGFHLLVAEDGSVTSDGKRPMLQLVNGKFWVSNHAHVLQGSTHQNTLLLYYILNNTDIRAFVTGAVQPKLSKVNLMRIKFTFPPLLEHKAITSFLDKWDEIHARALETIEKLIATTEKQLQGLQVSLLRPPNIPSTGWEFFRLGDIGEFRGGVTSIGVEDYGYGTPFISYLNVYDNSKVDINSLELMNVPSGDIEKLKCQYGDIFFTSSSEVIDEVAISSILLDSVDNLTFNGFCKRFRLKTFNNLLPEYARHLFRSPVFRSTIRVRVTGSTRFNINQHELEKIVIPLPPLPEQEAIVAQLEEHNKVWQEALAKYKELKEKYILQKQVSHTKLLNGKWRLNCD